MGSCSSNSSTISEKKLIIVGGSFAGLCLAEKLWSFLDVVIIDKNDFFEYTCTNPRFLINDSLTSSATLPYHQLIRAHGNKASFIQATLMRVNQDNSVLIQMPSGEKETHYFDFLAICTGSEYAHPTKDQQVFSLEERKSKLALEQQKVKQAQSVLVVGGGAVGVELMGELVAEYGKDHKKRLGIVSRADTLLKYFPREAQVAADEFMERNAVVQHLGVEFDQEFMQTYQYDHVIMCDGHTFRTPFMKEFFSDCTFQNGQIFVTDSLQVTNVDPLKSKTSAKKSLNQPEQKVYENIFCIGDACLTSCNEEKSIYPLKHCAEICATNILKLASGSQKLKRIPKAFPGLYCISLGPNEGIMVMNNYVKVGPEAARAKVQTEEMYMQALKGDEKVQERLQKRDEQIEQVLCCINCCCCCCKCATKRAVGRERSLKQLPQA